MLKNNKIFVMLFLAVGILAFYLFNNAIWFRLDGTPPYNDQAYHLLNCQYYTDFLRTLNIHSLEKVKNCFYPPLVYILGGFSSVVFGAGQYSCILTNLAFLVILIISLFMIAYQVFGRRTAIMSCLLIAFYPYIYGASREFSLEFPLTCFTSLMFWFFISRAKLSKLRYVIFLFIGLILGTLIKQNFIIYIAGPLLFLVSDLFKFSDKDKKKLLIAFFICLVWVISFLALFFHKSFVLLLKIHFRDARLFSDTGSYWKDLLFYAVLLKDQIGWPNLILFCFSLFILLRRANRERLIIFFWLIIPFLVLTLAPLKNPPYSLPLLPPIALISAYGIDQIKKNSLKVLVFVSLLLFSVIFHYFLLFKVNISINLHSGSISRTFQFFPPYYMKPYHEFVHIPQKNNLKEKQQFLFKTLLKYSNKNTGNMVIAITDASIASESDCPWFRVERKPELTKNYIVLNERGLRYYIKNNNLPIKVIQLSNLKRYLVWTAEHEFDFVLTSFPIDKFLKDIAHLFNLVEVIDFTDGSKIYIYLRKNT